MKCLTHKALDSFASVPLFTSSAVAAPERARPHRGRQRIGATPRLARRAASQKGAHT
jgi:hypothetical protein